jgi:hypothetical protein
MVEIDAISPESIEALGVFQRRAVAALRNAEAGPRPHAAMQRLGLEPEELRRTASLVVSAVIQLHDGAASGKPRELVHSEASYASAQLSELTAKMADVRARIEASRNRLRRLTTPRRPRLVPIFGWRPQASK